MTPSELKNLAQLAPKHIYSQTYSLFQRKLTSDVTPWIREVESTAKRLKKGKVILVAVLTDWNIHKKTPRLLSEGFQN